MKKYAYLFSLLILVSCSAEKRAAYHLTRAETLKPELFKRKDTTILVSKTRVIKGLQAAKKMVKGEIWQVDKKTIIELGDTVRYTRIADTITLDTAIVVRQSTNITKPNRAMAPWVFCGLLLLMALIVFKRK